MSALPPKADMDQQGRNVRFVPKADILQCVKKLDLAIRTIQRSNPRRSPPVSEASSYNEQPFGDCDVFVPRLEGHDPAAPDVFANGKGQKAVQALFPDLLIAWRLPESLGFVPSGWLWARLNVHKMAELSKGHTSAKAPAAWRYSPQG